MNIQSEKINHDFNVKMRREMNISGVNDVVSFDESDVHLVTNGGEMFIEGSEMRIDVLDTDKGVVILSGKIDSVYYSNDAIKEKRGFLGRIFK